MRMEEMYKKIFILSLYFVCIALSWVLLNYLNYFKDVKEKQNMLSQPIRDLYFPHISLIDDTYYVSKKPFKTYQDAMLYQQERSIDMYNDEQFRLQLQTNQIR